jgi:hypothetical protein
MTSGKLDFTSLRNALARLAEGYQRYQSDISDMNSPMKSATRCLSATLS